MTITADMKNGEAAYFKVIPSNGIVQFLDDVEKVTCPDDVVKLESEGRWTIV